MSYAGPVRRPRFQTTVNTRSRAHLDPWGAVNPSRQVLVDFCHDSFHADLLISTCGNASLRVKGARMLVSGTGTELGRLTSRDLSLVELATGSRVAGTLPTSELEVHRQIYLRRPDVGAILHCQTMAATLMACMEEPPTNLNLIPEVPAYVGRHAYVDYLRPGTLELGRAVARAFEDPEVGVVQMTNHGQVVVGTNPAQVLRRAIFFERACQIATSGCRLKYMSPAEAGHLSRTYGGGHSR